jgi:hypothetical protein
MQAGAAHEIFKIGTDTGPAGRTETADARLLGNAEYAERVPGARSR